MKLYLSPELKIREIKKGFVNEFPYLKLEFFNHKHLPGERDPFTQRVSDASSLFEVTGDMMKTEIDINPKQTVSELKQIFRRKLNIHIQIFRRSKYIWIETTQTDNFTLEKQNEMGGKACNAMYDEEIPL